MNLSFQSINMLSSIKTQGKTAKIKKRNAEHFCPKILLSKNLKIYFLAIKTQGQVANDRQTDRHLYLT